MFKGLEIIKPAIGEWLDALQVAKKWKLDFDDALVVACMKKRKINQLISFDKHFEKVGEIKLLKPQNF